MKDIFLDFIKNLNPKVRIGIIIGVVSLIVLAVIIPNKKPKNTDQANNNSIQTIVKDNGQASENNKTNAAGNGSNNNQANQDFNNKYFNLHIDKIEDTSDNIVVTFRYFVKDVDDNNLVFFSPSNTTLVTNSGYCALLKFEGKGLIDFDKVIQDNTNDKKQLGDLPLILNKSIPLEQRLAPSSEQVGKLYFRKIDGIDISKPVKINTILVSNSLINKWSTNESGYGVDQPFKEGNPKYIQRFENDTKPYVFPIEMAFTQKK